MALTLIRSLSLSVLRNFASLKRDAKRLHRRSAEVFGREYSLSVCQRAMAVSRGFNSLQEVEHFAARIQSTRDAPFWTLRGRNQSHEHVLDALFRIELEVSDEVPVAMLGPQAHALTPALVLFMEEMSARGRPGLILVETEAGAIEDTVLNGAIQQLGLEEIFEGFRSLNLRENKLPVSLSTDARCWSWAIRDVLPRESREEMNRGWCMAVEQSAKSYAKQWRLGEESLGFSGVGFGAVDAAATLLAQSRYWPNWLSDTERDFVELEYGSKPPALPPKVVQQVLHVIGDLRKRSFDTGYVMASESLRRPCVALFSRRDPASEVLAAVLHSLYYWQHVIPGGPSRTAFPPVLYLSEGDTPYASTFLGSGANTIVVNGAHAAAAGDDEAAFSGLARGMNVLAGPSTLQYMGRRVQYASDAPTAVES